MMSSSEVQRITLSAKKIVSPTGAIDVEVSVNFYFNGGIFYLFFYSLFQF